MITPIFLFKSFIHSKACLGTCSVIFSAVALDAAFLGNMFVAVLVAVIGATPPTIAIIMMSRKQSLERKEAQSTIITNQKKMAEDLDGKLDRLSKAETGQAKAEGIIEGGDKEKARAETVSPAAIPQVTVANTKENPVVNKPAR